MVPGKWRRIHPQNLRWVTIPKQTVVSPPSFCRSELFNFSVCKWFMWVCEMSILQEFRTIQGQWKHAHQESYYSGLGPKQSSSLKCKTFLQDIVWNSELKNSNIKKRSCFPFFLTKEHCLTSCRDFARKGLSGSKELSSWIKKIPKKESLPKKHVGSARLPDVSLEGPGKLPQPRR